MEVEWIEEIIIDEIVAEDMEVEWIAEIII